MNSVDASKQTINFEGKREAGMRIHFAFRAVNRGPRKTRFVGQRKTAGLSHVPSKQTILK
jgi:hypothetical protein